MTRQTTAQRRFRESSGTVSGGVAVGNEVHNITIEMEIVPFSDDLTQ